MELVQSKYKYCDSLLSYRRRESREVAIGNTPLGGVHPIRIQSMTVTPTMDTDETVAESIRIIDSGSDYVRITAPSIREAENLAVIKKKLRYKGYNHPLIADIHFTPNAADVAARIVEKVRINPGNYADRKKFSVTEYTDSQYNEELERIHVRFTPLIKICKEYGTAMRIGTNHGSLSDRIMNRYGDTPLGMVESAMEFIRICEDNRYFDIVLSMKASNPLVMVQAYRLLVHRMDIENMNYPLHLGVTEAGEGEDGRIKSAMGIGTLLEDGLGDTIRVSLTEPPEVESPVALKIVNRYTNRESDSTDFTEYDSPVNSFEYIRKTSKEITPFGGNNPPQVIADFHNEVLDYTNLAAIGYSYDTATDTWNIADAAADFVYLGNSEPSINITPALQCIYDFEYWGSLKNNTTSFPIIRWNQYDASQFSKGQLHFIEIPLDEFDTDKLSSVTNAVIVLKGTNKNTLHDYRKVYYELINNDILLPVVLQKTYVITDDEEFQLLSAIDIGGLLIDGFGNGVWLNPSSEFTVRTAFGILQASRTRISKTDYISCPSCGRTLFDLQITSAKIRARTDHLKGLKIGIMGCIVNGPGEMADADYGYVGSGVGKITLYRGQEVIKKNIPTEQAVDALIELIQEDGNWFDP